MSDELMGVLFVTGFVAASVWYGYRGLNIGRAYQAVRKHNSSDSSVGDGNRTTLEGKVVVDEPVTAGGSDSLVESAPRPAVVIWRIRRGTRSKFDEAVGSPGDWTTVKSGVDAGTFKIDTGVKEVRVDPTWITEYYNDATLQSVSASDMHGSGFRSKAAWKIPFVCNGLHRESFNIVDRDVFSSDVYDQLGSDQQKYRLELKVIPEGAPLAVHGRIDLERGEPVIRGSDDVPMILSGRGPDALKSALRDRMLKVGGYAVVLLIFAAATLYAAVQPILL